MESSRRFSSEILKRFLQKFLRGFIQDSRIFFFSSEINPINPPQIPPDDLSGIHSGVFKEFFQRFPPDLQQFLQDSSRISSRDSYRTAAVSIKIPSKIPPEACSWDYPVALEVFPRIPLEVIVISPAVFPYVLQWLLQKYQRNCRILCNICNNSLKTH